jgi:hypothetical protein
MSNYDYTSRDYTSIQKDLLDRATRVLPDWTSRDASDFGMIFVDLWAYMGDILHYYVDRAAGESNLTTATQRESVLAIASLMDYIPSSRTPARGEVTLNIANSVGTDTVPVLIPKYTRLVATPRNSSATSVVFTLDNPIAITSTVSGSYFDATSGTNFIAYSKVSTPVITVQVTEGERYEEYFTASGKLSQQIQLGNSGVVRSSVTVNVAEGQNGDYVEYAFVDRVLETTSSQKVFYLETTATDRSVVVFGNGVNGAIPVPNAEIIVNYRRSRGDAGNLPAYSIKAFEGTLSTGSSLNGVVVVGNVAPLIGGSDSESMSSMKTNIPLSFRTQDRAVSLQDYADLALRVPGISIASATVSGSTVTLRVVSNETDYSSRTIAQNTIAANTAVEEAVSTYLSTRTVAGITVSVTSAVSLNRVRVKLALQVLDGYIRQSVESDVIDAIRSLFVFDNVEFSGSVSLGTLYRTIMNTTGVDYVTISQFTKGSTDVIDSSGSFQGVTATTGNLLYIPSDGLPIFTSSTGGITGSEV